MGLSGSPNTLRVGAIIDISIVSYLYYCCLSGTHLLVALV